MKRFEDNTLSEVPLEALGAKVFGLKLKEVERVVGHSLQVTLADLSRRSPSKVILGSLVRGSDQKALKNQDDLIFAVHKQDDGYSVKTGNYVGNITWQGLTLNIASRFSDAFLKRMLNFVNDVYLDDVDLSSKETEHQDTAQFIVCYLFVQSLEKAFLLGLPKSYQTVAHHEVKLKGRVDINGLMRHDLPFRGKISSVSREQKVPQEVIDVLFRAIELVGKSHKGLLKNIKHVKNHVQQYRSGRAVSQEVMQKALTDKSLRHPMFAPYVKVLEYAQMIIQRQNLDASPRGIQTKGFLVNVAELFEVYVRKLLQRRFPEWSVASPELMVYEGMFFARKIIPDIVMSRADDVLVFDTKYKRMNFKGREARSMGDLDRADFFQINAYMSFYQNTGKKVLVGGLLYPMESAFDENKQKCHSPMWFENKQTRFVVDGLDLSGLEDGQTDQAARAEEIIKQENAFIERVASLMTLSE
jgi:5-methylcytosine-specific restriction enzyme subunit McrC